MKLGTFKRERRDFIKQKRECHWYSLSELKTKFPDTVNMFADTFKP